MGAKVFFSLEQIPSRYGTGYKAKMKRHETRDAILQCLLRHRDISDLTAEGRVWYNSHVLRGKILVNLRSALRGRRMM